MKKAYARFVSVSISFIIVCSLITGCSSKQDKAKNMEGTTKEGSSSEYSLPIVKEPLTLTYWKALDSNKVAAGLKTLNDTVYMQEVEKKTGIKINFIHPALGQESTQFNLMMASNDLPDMINYNWNSFSGGPEKALNDNIIIKHNELIEKYAYNFNNFVKSKPGIEKMFKTDTGTMYCMPGFQTMTPDGQPHAGPTKRELKYESAQGLIIREDWLKDLGLSLPSTIDEWYNVLKAFKEKKGASYPLTFTCSPRLDVGRAFNGSGAFYSAYGISHGFYEDDDKKVQYGPARREYRELLTTLAKWYKEGLIDQDFATNDQKALDAKVTGEKAGAWVGAPGGGVGSYMAAIYAKNPTFSITGVRNPALNKGDKVKYGSKTTPFVTTYSTAITTKNKYPVESIKYLDYAYSDEGDMLYNWGVEGVSYEMVNGQPKFKEIITKNPQGLPIQQAMMKYILWTGTSAQDYATRIELHLSYGTPKVREAVKAWEQCEKSTELPPVSIASNKTDQFARIMSDVNTLVDEKFLKIVMGVESIDSFDKYIEQLKKMGIDQAITIQQEALDRYYKR